MSSAAHSLVGVVRTNDNGSISVSLGGVVADAEGIVHSGTFVAGSNPVGVATELIFEEWLPATVAGRIAAHEYPDMVDASPLDAQEAINATRGFPI